MDNINPMLILQIIIVIGLAFFIIYIIKFNLSLRLVKRIRKYSIEPLNNNTISFIDNILNIYKKIINRLSKILIKSKRIDRFSHRYDIYIDYLSNMKPIDFISNKLFIAFLFFLIDILFNIIFIHPLVGIEMIIIIIIGYYVPDMYGIYKNYVRHKLIERDLLNAIILLNNAFKSGRSTMQAIEIVKAELTGPIKIEFEKMHTEITYGLSLESVFERFAERVDIEEISYITSSLSVLNKTGGNIIQVFSSIEKSLYNKYRLESELQSLTSSSKIMSNILLILPFVFSGIIILLNPTYFNPLFNNYIGLSVFFVMIMFYVLYAFLVHKIMRVRLW